MDNCALMLIDYLLNHRNLEVHDATVAAIYAVYDFRYDKMPKELQKILNKKDTD